MIVASVRDEIFIAAYYLLNYNHTTLMCSHVDVFYHALRQAMTTYQLLIVFEVLAIGYLSQWSQITNDRSKKITISGVKNT